MRLHPLVSLVTRIALAAMAVLAWPAAGGAQADTTSAVAARRIARGATLSEGDFVAAPGTGSRNPVAPGWIARRVIQPGEALRPPAVAPAAVIQSGRAVRYTVERAGIQLVLSATSLSAGALGDTIPVRLDARRRVLAIVSGPGNVVTLPESTR